MTVKLEKRDSCEWLSAQGSFGSVSFLTGRRGRAGCQNEDPQPEADVGMGSIVGDIPQSISHGARVQGGRGAIRLFFDFIPDAVEVAPGSYGIDEIVGGVGDPEGSD